MAGKAVDEAGARRIGDTVTLQLLWHATVQMDTRTDSEEDEANVEADEGALPPAALASQFPLIPLRGHRMMASVPSQAGG
jgi:hypothetical protein